MPGKSLCPNCGQKFRSASHLCHPNSIKARAKWRAAREVVAKK